jgi:hypothetical protein
MIILSGCSLEKSKEEIGRRKDMDFDGFWDGFLDV